MGGVKFTKEQQQSIDTLDKSILVAAAAGSGKTAVLVQRIIKIVLEGRANVDELLIVTFTKAAAAEMRVKIARAIKKRMQEDPANRAKLKDQLDRLYRAYICTFDSFAGRVIKEFFYLKDMEPNYKTCDEIQSVMLKRDAVDRLFEEAFEQDDIIDGCSFREFLRLYSSDRREDDIKTELIKSYDALRSMPNYFAWSEAKAGLLLGDGATGPVAEIICRDFGEAAAFGRARLEDIRELYISNGIESSFEKMFGDEVAYVDELEAAAKRGTVDKAFTELVEGFSFKSLQSYTKYFEGEPAENKKIYASFRTQITPIRNEFKDKLDGLKKDYFVPSFDTRVREMNATYKYTVYYINLMKKIEEYYQWEKKERGVLDFADMEHFAVSILEDEKAQETLRNRFKFIFIDEYQDTNYIQETLIGQIARENNVFKVGDVKQSIYRFRQAEPKIFQDTYEAYSADSNDNAIAIDLNRNFRSNDRTLKYINYVFEGVMDGYDDRARLYTGIRDFTDYPDEYDFKPEVHILNKELASGSDAEAYEESAEDGTVEAVSDDDEIESITKDEAEAEYIAGLVNGIIGTEFYDSNEQRVRKAEPKDIAILARSVKMRGERIARALRNYAVQAHIEDDDDFFDTVEVSIAISLFSCIDNMKRDVPLIATLHSEIFDWSPEELARVRIDSRNNIPYGADSYSRRTAYWEALLWYAESGPDAELKGKARFARDTILGWRQLSNMMPLEDFIWKVLIDSNYYLKVGAMYGGDRRQANLRVLVDRARKFTEDTVAGLSSFIDYVEVMKKQGVNNGQTGMVGKDDNVVKITTIHKSKGLEYPFVIVAALGVKLEKSGSEPMFLFDNRTGIGMRYVSPDRKYWRSTLMQRVIKTSISDEEYRENLRVLYVAMTRARNKLCLVGSAAKESEVVEVKGRPKTFLQVLGEKIRSEHNDIHMEALVEKLPVTPSNRINSLLKSRPDTMSPEVAQLHREVSRRLEFKYPEEEIMEKSKFSVSELRKLAYQPAEDEMNSLVKYSRDQKKASAADIGIAYHRVMEFLDFAKACPAEGAGAGDNASGSADMDYIRERVQFLVDNDAIDQEVSEALDMDKIRHFFETEIGRCAVAGALSGNLRKEKSFTLRTDYEGREIMVQGIIDLMWKDEEGWILVDYKSSRVKPDADHDSEMERLRNEYEMQIKLYAEAITKGTGMPVQEAYLYIMSTGDLISMEI